MAPDVVGSTSIGTGTTKTLLGGKSLILPEWARAIVAIIPIVTIDVPTVSESVLAKCVLESEDFTIGPFEVLASPISACLGATISPLVSEPEKYLVNCPVPGGAKLDIYGEALVANTTAPVMSCAVIISSEPPTGKQRFAKMGAITSTGTVASTDVPGTPYSFSKGREIIEVFGVVAPDTVAAGDAMTGYIRLASSEFARSTPCKMPFTPIAGGLSTIFSTKIDGVSRLPVRIPLEAGQKNISDYLYMDLAPAAAGNWVSGVIVE
jgi:hypothetical protein